MAQYCPVCLLNLNGRCPSNCTSQLATVALGRIHINVQISYKRIYWMHSIRLGTALDSKWFSDHNWSLIYTNSSWWHRLLLSDCLVAFGQWQRLIPHSLTWLHSISNQVYIFHRQLCKWQNISYVPCKCRPWHLQEALNCVDFILLTLKSTLKFRNDLSGRFL